MQRKFLLIWFIMVMGFGLQLRAANPTDSLLVKETHKPHFVFNFDTHYTLFDNDRARISGLKTGIEWNNKWRTGLGYYFLSTPIVTSLPAKGIDKKDIEARVKFRYAAVYGEYVLFKNHKWEASFPLQLGFGKTQNEYRNTAGEIEKTGKQFVWLVEPSVSGHYKICNWVGIGAGFGYRQMLNASSREVDHLNAPIYYLKVKLFAGELYRDLRKKHCAATE